MKIRYGICLVSGLTMLIWALPYLSFEGNKAEAAFSFAWLVLAFSVLAGNLSAILYSEGNKRTNTQLRNAKNTLNSRQYKRSH
jgi:hypothetical protein